MTQVWVISLDFSVTRVSVVWVLILSLHAGDRCLLLKMRVPASSPNPANPGAQASSTFGALPVHLDPPIPRRVGLEWLLPARACSPPWKALDSLYFLAEGLPPCVPLTPAPGSRAREPPLLGDFIRWRSFLSLCFFLSWVDFRDDTGLGASPRPSLTGSLFSFLHYYLFKVAELP